MLSRAVLTAGLVVVFSSAALGQQPPPGPSDRTGDPRKDARVHFGPFHFTPILTVTRLGVDTNVFNEAGEQKSDFVADLTPRVMLWVPLARRAMITSDLESGFTYYHSFPTERSIDPSVSLRGELYVRRLTLFGEGAFSRSSQRPNYEIDDRVLQELRGASAGFDLRLGSRTTVGVSAYRDRSRFADDEQFLGTDLSEVLNRDQEGLRLELRQRLTSLTSLSLTADSRRDRFVTAAYRDADGYRISPGFEFRPKALVSGTVEVGYRHLEPKDPAVPKFDGVIARMGVSYRMGDATALGLDWNRDVQYSYDTTRPYYVENGLAVNLRRQLGGRFDGIARVDRHALSYVILAPETMDPSRSTTWTYSLDIGYRVNRETRMGVNVEWVERTSKPAAGRDFSGLRAGLSFNLGY